MTENQTAQPICQLTMADIQFIKQTLSDLSRGSQKREEAVMLLGPLRDFEECLRRLADAFSPCEHSTQPARNEGRALNEEEVHFIVQVWQDTRDAYLQVRDIPANSPSGRLFGKFIRKLGQAHKNLEKAVNDRALSGIRDQVTYFGRALSELMGQVSGELTRNIREGSGESEVRQ